MVGWCLVQAHMGRGQGEARSEVGCVTVWDHHHQLPVVSSDAFGGAKRGDLMTFAFLL
jgi:hypothetical protein